VTLSRDLARWELPPGRRQLHSAEIRGPGRNGSPPRGAVPGSGGMGASPGGDPQTAPGCKLPSWDVPGIWRDGSAHRAMVSSPRRRCRDLAGKSASAVGRSRDLERGEPTSRRCKLPSAKIRGHCRNAGFHW